MIWPCPATVLKTPNVSPFFGHEKSTLSGAFRYLVFTACRKLNRVLAAWSILWYSLDFLRISGCGFFHGTLRWDIVARPPEIRLEPNGILVDRWFPVMNEASLSQSNQVSVGEDPSSCRRLYFPVMAIFSVPWLLSLRSRIASLHPDACSSSSSDICPDRWWNPSTKWGWDVYIPHLAKYTSVSFPSWSHISAPMRRANALSGLLTIFSATALIWRWERMPEPDDTLVFLAAMALFLVFISPPPQSWFTSLKMRKTADHCQLSLFASLWSISQCVQEKTRNSHSLGKNQQKHGK